MASYVFFIVFLSISAQGNSTSIHWSMGLFGRSTDDSFSSSRVTGITAGIKGNHALSDSLFIDFQGGARLETGSSSALFTDEFRPKSRIFLRESALRWKPTENGAVRLGALNQSHHESPLLLENGTFPALRLSYENSDPWHFALDGQGAIPVSESLSTRSTGKEKTPQLLTARAKGGYQLEGFSLLGRISRFTYSNLTRGMAQDSRFYGNEIAGIANGSRFIYQFQGWELGPDLRLTLSDRWSVHGKGSFLHNEKGPRGNNQGSFGEVGVSFKEPTWKLVNSFQIYRMDSDAAPGYFSSSEFGHNNRKGKGASLKLELNQPNITFELKARQGNLLRPSPFQKDRFKFLELSLEVPFGGI